ncbi:MAG TPA: response regulator transcription factor [Acidimicrobiales bacterium]|nr:response regulator transcription factor [Acidimicrobiales bacterium]
MRGTVLVVEDETKLRELVRSFLEREGLSVLTTGSGAEALSLEEKVAPDVVVLDLGLPDVPGNVVARELRRRSDVLLLMLTARASEEDRVLGLELGADDYLTKPFSPRELVLRVQAMLRRGRSAEAPPGPASYGGGRLVVDDVRHEVRRDGELVRLSPTEWSILETLARTPGRVYSRYELVNSARGYEWEGYERVVDSHVKNLRHKLGDDGREPRIIETVVGVGYRLGLSLDR